MESLGENCLSLLSVGVQLITITQHPQTNSLQQGEGMVIIEWVFKRKRRFISHVPHFNNRDWCVVKHLP